jgi:hypothetical protein
MSAPRAWLRPGLVLVLAMVPPAVSSAADVFGGYSSLRLQGDDAPGGSLAVSWPVRPSLAVVAEASGQLGLVRGEDLQEWALLGGPSFSPWRGHRLIPFVHVKAGLVRSRRQVDILGVAIGPGGVCDGACPSEFGFAAEAGGGVDFRLSDRFSLRIQGDYRLVRLESDSAGRLRLSAGLVLRARRASRPRSDRVSPAPARLGPGARGAPGRSMPISQ